MFTNNITRKKSPQQLTKNIYGTIFLTTSKQNNKLIPEKNKQCYKKHVLNFEKTKQVIEEIFHPNNYKEKYNLIIIMAQV